MYYHNCYTETSIAKILTKNKFKGKGSFGSVYVSNVSNTNDKLFAFKAIKHSDSDYKSI